MRECRYRYEVLLAFVMLEVLLFGAPKSLQSAVAILEYVFVLWALHRDTRVGLMYFVSFTLLSMGAWTYVMPDSEAANFWGLRLIGPSFNILFTVGICVIAPIWKAKAHDCGLPGRFMKCFVLYSLAVGLIATLASINYFDNFFADAAVYLTYLVYIRLLSVIDIASIYKIIQYGLSVTVVGMLLSWITGNMFHYSENDKFVLMNGFGFIAIFAVFLARKLYSRRHYAFLAGSMGIMLLSNTVFLGGKALFCFVITLLWAAAHSRRAMLVVVILLVGFLVFQNSIVDFLSDRVPESALLAYKTRQIVQTSEKSSLDILAATPTSAGNIVAEGRTVFTYMSEHPLLLLFGKGLGGGVEDVYNYLAPQAKVGFGYSDRDVERNDFLRMHLPIYDITLKAGIVGLLCYLAALIQVFRTKNMFAFVSFVLMGMVLTNTKEMILLTAVFLTASAHYSRMQAAVTEEHISSNMGWKSIWPSARRSAGKAEAYV